MLHAQGWPAARQRVLLQALPASLVGEATFQVLLQASSGCVASVDDEDEEGRPLNPYTIQSRLEAAKAELERATGIVLGLPFEEKVKLVTELEPKAAAALVGACCRRPNLACRLNVVPAGGHPMRRPQTCIFHEMHLRFAQSALGVAAL